jgi:uncharacterized protein (DUF2062 family)
MKKLMIAITFLLFCPFPAFADVLPFLPQDLQNLRNAWAQRNFGNDWVEVFQILTIGMVGASVAWVLTSRKVGRHRVEKPRRKKCEKKTRESEEK